MNEKELVRENELSNIVINRCIHIHKLYGPGLLESVYERILLHELTKLNLPCRSQVAIPLIHEDIRMEIGFRADIIVDNCLILEIKACDVLAPVHHSQVATYLKLTKLRLGLLLNFNVPLMKDGVKRIVL